MSEKDEIAREILPFLVDLFPGVSEGTLLTVIKYLFLAAVMVIALYVTGLVLVRLYVRQVSKHYIKNLPVLKSLQVLDIDGERKKMIHRLILDSVILGSRLDFHTDRKNNSKAVSQIVWDMCRRQNIEAEKSVFYACAAMVYDVGFLDVNASLFHAEVLSSKERKILRAHIMNSYEHLLFIPEEVRSVFFDAAMLHHENYDGSGYPEGLHGNDIPEIAQMIRVAESYVSLTSKRRYRKVFSREEAFKELSRYSADYSPQWLDILKRIV